MPDPLLITLKTAAAATVMTFFLGIFFARAVVKLKRFKGLADAVLTLPLILPPTVVGFFLLLLFGKRGVVGKFLLQFDVSLVFTWQAAVISAVVVSLPLMYRTTRGAFEQLDRNILDAARTLGASESKIFWRIMLPNARFGILAGTVLTFARAAGEFGATMMFAGNIPGQTQTMSTAIYAAVQANDYDSAFRYTSLLSLCSIVFMLAVNVVTSKRGEQR